MATDVPSSTAEAEAILEFWFSELSPRDWFRENPALDREIRRRFEATQAAAARCELWTWRSEPAGRLAEIIVLDQFSRNIFRHTARAFACDALALALAQTAVAAGADQALPVSRRAFAYMPYMHSESLAIHAQALRLFNQPGLEKDLEQERQHHALLLRFNRYPQRNAALGRKDTPAERAFLAGRRPPP